MSQAEAQPPFAGPVAIVHEWLTTPGGSEQVVEALLEIFPHADLYAGLCEERTWRTRLGRPVQTTFLGRLPAASRYYRLLVPALSYGFRRLKLGRYRLVISSNHASAKDLRLPSDVLHICYCHTPMRYLWEPRFLATERGGRLVAAASAPFLTALRRRDRRAAQGPDLILANSHHTAQRIERFWGREARVVYPPVRVERFLSIPRQPEPFYLTFGRLVPYKRHDLAIAACALLGRPLLVAGSGRAEGKLRQLAARLGAPVQFLGEVSDAQRDHLYARARALLFPGEEDFGIVPVEAQAAGLPVIALARGGARESVQDGVSGVLFQEQTAAGLAAAIQRFEQLDLEEQAVRAAAGRFGWERFRRELAIAVQEAVAARQASGR
jgi:glycosyltransferase involved in cell wall biosynthesis